MSIIAIHEKNIVKEPKWTNTEKYYSTDDLISANLVAFKSGKEVGVSEFKDSIEGLVVASIQNAQQQLAELYKEMEDANISIHSLHMKANDATKYEAAFVIPKDIFLFKGFNTFVTRAIGIEKSFLKNRPFELRILFIPALIDLELIENNLAQFQWTYEYPKSQSSQA